MGIIYLRFGQSYDPWCMTHGHPYTHCTTHHPWTTDFPSIMGRTAFLSPMGHGSYRALYGDVWTMTHGEKVAEPCGWCPSPGPPSSLWNNFGLHFLPWQGQHQHFLSYFFYHPCWGSTSAWSSPSLAGEGPWPFFAVLHFKYPTCTEGNQSGGLLDGIILCCYVYIWVWVASSNHCMSCPFQAQVTSLKDSQW